MDSTPGIALSPDSKMIADVYDAECDLYGENEGWKASLWASRENQQQMFRILSYIGDLSDCSILEVGCGQGDFYEFLEPQFQNLDYTGIDISGKMLEHARKKLPEVKFEQRDFLADNFISRFDYLFAGGTFNFKIFENQQDYLEFCIEKLFILGKKAIAFSVLSERLVREKQDMLSYHDPAKVLDFCLTLTNKVVLNHWSVPNQVVVFMWK